uniref:Uncharacterized protein n=1 Tax=Anguilla anguilla TaxID=7936 RepID=A0A0E9RWA6_ANGAN
MPVSLNQLIISDSSASTVNFLFLLANSLQLTCSTQYSTPHCTLL